MGPSAGILHSQSFMDVHAQPGRFAGIHASDRKFVGAGDSGRPQYQFRI